MKRIDDVRSNLYKIVVIVHCSLLPGLAIAQEDPLLQDTVIVSGSRNNPMLSGVSPEVSLDFAEIRAYGADSLEELLADLAPLTQSARGGAPAILLNGRRISSLREIRNYPPEALARVEVLPEAVALKFGFRADQKVTNFILRDRFHALSTRSRLGGATDGGQWLGEAEASNLRIRNDNRWNVDVEYEYQDALFESDRDVIREVGSTSADRTLLPQVHELGLTASLSHFLPGDISATYTLGADAISEQRAIAQSDLNDTIDRDRDQLGFEASGVLNQVHDKWNWTLNTSYTYQDETSQTVRDPISGFEESTDATAETFSLEGIVFRNLAELPAGDVVTTVTAGFDTQSLSSVSDQSGLRSRTDLSRDETSLQANLDVPLLDRSMTTNPFGGVTLNGNIRWDDLSDVGTLSTYGGGVTWKPSGQIQIIASTARSQLSPSLNLLANPISVTENATVFDFSTGETVEGVTRITGGIEDLEVETRTEHQVNLSWEPFDERDVTLNLVFTETETDNAILDFPGLSPEIERAFPDRVVRGSDGTLLSLDARAINISERTAKRLRYGVNWSLALPRPEHDLTREERQQLRQILLRRLDEEDRVRVEQRIAERQATRSAGQGRGEGLGQRRGRGRGGGRGGRGSNRVFASLYHTWVLEDSLLINPGDARLDLLDGDAISDQGGTAKHQISAQAGVNRGAIGGFVRFNWQSGTEIEDGRGNLLRFDDLGTTDLRLRYSFGDNPRLLLRYPFLDSARVSIGVDNLFYEKQTVKDAAGVIPIRYQADLLDPQGRVVTVRFRKLFF